MSCCALRLAVAGVDRAPGGGEGGAEEDDDDQDDEEEGSDHDAAATQGTAGDRITRQETQRTDAATAPVQTGRTRQGARRRDRTNHTILLLYYIY